MAIPKTLKWENGYLVILDQTLLPGEIIYKKLLTIEEVWEAIYSLRVRGAPAIGVAAVYGALTGLADKTGLPVAKFKALFKKQAEYLGTSRPTGVNLRRGLDLMLKCMQSSTSAGSHKLYEELLAEAVRIHAEDIELCENIGVYGAELIKDGMGILTHCNAGALATTGIGTALAPMYKAIEKGLKFKVYADETRPLLQGARLTAWELKQSGVDVTLICDNMAAYIMSRKMTDIVITGCDRVAANGDGANKIGTLGVAVLAKYYGVPFYMACPSSSIDFLCANAEDIPVEMRDSDEVRKFHGVYASPADVNVYNPSFDVTPASLITGYITEKGLVRPPYDINLKKLFG